MTRRKTNKRLLRSFFPLLEKRVSEPFDYEQNATKNSISINKCKNERLNNLPTLHRTAKVLGKIGVTEGPNTSHRYRLFNQRLHNLSNTVMAKQTKTVDFDFPKRTSFLKKQNNKIEAVVSI